MRALIRNSKEKKVLNLSEYYLTKDNKMFYLPQINGNKTSVFIIIFMFIMIIPATAIIMLTITTLTILFMVSKIRQVSIQQIHNHQTYKVFQQKKFR